ncbi:pilus assembly protein N-terminal domain-containing protein [Thermostilla marina]
MMKRIGRLTAIVLVWAAFWGGRQWLHAQNPAPQPPGNTVTPALQTGNSAVFKVTSSMQRLEITVNSSRIITLEKRIPQAQVNNPEILELTALSPNQVQVFAKKAGVTQVNFWDEDGRIYTVDVIVFGDARELSLLLKSQFPNASIEVIPISSGVLLSGYVDQQEHIPRIMQIAEEYYPKVISNLTVGGVHEVLLHVKVMEVSRTKLRELGFDWGQISGNSTVRSSPSGLLSAVNPAQTSYDPSVGIVIDNPISAVTSGGETFAFSVIDGGSAFFGVLEALRQDNLMKVLAEPTLVTVSGRPAFFQVGGEFPILVPQSLGTVSIEYKKYGTQVDFVPIVLGNGRIRLEVRPRVSEIDSARSVTINSTTVPGLRVREVDTGVEMQAGQTLAIAGLVQTRTEAERRGLPWVSDVPYLGMAFRKVMERQNEVELLILVTPELVDAMDPEEVPPCGPGTQTASPTDGELYFKGYIETPRCCPPGSPAGEKGAGGGGQMLDITPQGLTVKPVDPQASAKPGVIHPASQAQSKPQTSSDRQNRNESSSPQKLPGFIGPVGYEGAR